MEDRPAGSTTFTYRVCQSGGCFAPGAAFYVQAADSTGATSYTFFDAFERPVGSDSPLAGGRRSRERTVYLANGNVYQRSLPYVAGETAHFVTMSYDALGRTLTEDDEETGTAAAYEYLGHALEVTDGNDHTTRYEHNALGQIERVVDAANGETAYTYHPFGELYTVTDDDANETEILYDARGFKTDMFDPDMGHWQYDHNAYGELIEQTDAKSQVVTLEYDAAGRLISRDEDEGLTEWEFYPHTASAGHAGRLYQVTSPGSLSEVYEYHATHGAVTEIVRSIGASSYELDFEFDTHGRLEQINYPLNVDSQRLGVEYLFDSWGVLSQARNATTTSLVYFALNEQDGSGAVRRATLGNGLVEQYGYEPTTGRLASIKTGPTGATLQDLEFEWDLAGNLEQREIRNASGTLVDTDVFNYDAVDRLTSVVRDSSTILSVGYDALGNITSKTSLGTYTYGGSRPHAVTAIGSQTFAYDGNGNMEDRNGTEIDWTSYNLPSRIERPSGEYSEFLYGADRSRYRQIEGAGALQSTRHYASPGLFEVLTWNSGSSRVDYHYIHANGRAVAQFTTSNVEADELQYLHRDHQANVVATTSTSGSVLDRFEYDAFGVRTTTVGDDDRSHRGYTGHEHLAALDLVHMNGRVQDPLLGKFLSPDPFVQAPYHSQSLNRYSYVWNNPLSLVDPSGFGVCKDDGRGNGIEDCEPEDFRRFCIFFFSCEGLDFQDQLWLAEEFGLEQRQPAFIFDPPALVAEAVPAPARDPQSLESAIHDTLTALKNAGLGILELGAYSSEVPAVREQSEAFRGARGKYDTPWFGHTVEILGGGGGVVKGAGAITRAARGATVADNVATFGANSVGAAQRVPRVMQTGGQTITQQTADALNTYAGTNLPRREVGRALEALKKAHGLPNDLRGSQILDNGNLLDDAGKLIDNIIDYFP